MRASQYDGPLSEGSGSSWMTGLLVQGAVGLLPEHHVAGVRAGRGLQVGQPAEHREGLPTARVVAGLLPVAQVDHGGARDVVGVERALVVGVGVGVVRPAADPLVAATVLVLGVGPEHADLRLRPDPVRRVARLRRRRHAVAQEVEVREVREPPGLVRRRRGRGAGGHHRETGGDQHGRHGGGELHGHPFTPLLMLEAVKCRWKARNSATAGAASTTAPARIAPYGLVARPAMVLM